MHSLMVLKVRSKNQDDLGVIKVVIPLKTILWFTATKCQPVLTHLSGVWFFLSMDLIGLKDANLGDKI